MVSRDIRRILTQRAQYFNIVLDDVSITQLTFSRDYTAAVESKQVAQQDAERAKFVVCTPCLDMLPFILFLRMSFSPCYTPFRATLFSAWLDSISSSVDTSLLSTVSWNTG